MTNLPRNTSMLMLIGALVVIIVGLIVWRLFIITGNKQEAAPQSSSKPTPQSNTNITSTYFEPNLFSYSKAQINKTTDSEVKKITNIKQSSSVNDKNQYTYPSFYPSRDNLIQTVKGVVVFERTITITNELTHPDLTKYLDQFGKADKEVRGSKYYGPYLKTYIFASSGLTIIANPATKEVYEIQRYQPTTVEGYLKNWGEDVP